MWKLLTTIPKKCFVAVSGGADSIAILHFLHNKGKRDITAAMFDHGTGLHSATKLIVDKMCSELNIKLIEGQSVSDIPRKISPEEHWRNERYNWLESLDGTVVTGHNLDDTIETYLWSCCHGNPKTIPLIRNNVIRPFMTVSHQEMAEYCERNNLQYYDDPANKDVRFARTNVRYGLKKEIEKINPGFRNMMKRKITKEYLMVV